MSEMVLHTYNFQVGDNGIISLNNSYNAWTARLLPLSRTQFIAPYWADFDSRGTGQIYYRQTKNPTLLARATKEIRAAFPLSQNVIINNLFIVTWDAVGYYSYGIDKVNYAHNNNLKMYIASQKRKV